MHAHRWPALLEAADGRPPEGRQIRRRSEIDLTRNHSKNRRRTRPWGPRFPHLLVHGGSASGLHRGMGTVARDNFHRRGPGGRQISEGGCVNGLLSAQITSTLDVAAASRSASRRERQADALTHPMGKTKTDRNTQRYVAHPKKSDDYREERYKPMVLHQRGRQSQRLVFWTRGRARTQPGRDGLGRKVMSSSSTGSTAARSRQDRGYYVWVVQGPW